MRRGRKLIVWVAIVTALGAAAAGAEVEAEAVAAAVRVEKIFHYEDGTDYVNAVAENGVTLGEVWPGLYAVGYSGYFGSNLTLFDDAGKVINEYIFDEERPETNRTFFPSANGAYYLNTCGMSGYDARGDPPIRAYYRRDGEELWSSSGIGSTGYVAVSPVGDRVLYIQGNELYPRTDSKILFRDPSGREVGVEAIPFLGEVFNFTVDGDYFLVSESSHSGRGSDFGTAVFDREGRLLFFLDPDLQACISWGRCRAAIGGGGGYFYQIGYKVERTESDGRIFISDRLFDKGRLLQIYDSNGNKLREHKVSTNEWGAGLSRDGELIAFVPADPGDEI